MKSKIRKKSKNGTVYLVGAGPGDIGLLTLKGKECLEKAEIVFYDSLVNPDIFQFCPQAKLVAVGKKPYHSHISQKKIEKLLNQSAKKYQIIVRLKGGDPFLFGRGGEEGEALAKAKINFQIVPGVSSALAVPAYAGIPLTHREFGSSVMMVTGHGYQDETGISPNLDWDSLSRQNTLVFLMGLKSLPQNFKKLINAGMPSNTPAAVIEQGTYPFQRTVTGTLQTIPKLVKKSKIHPPSITIVGKIVSLRNVLKWFEKKPLFGKKILVTREIKDGREIEKKLTDLGAQTILFPTISIAPVKKFHHFDKVIRDKTHYDWIFFTSRNAVRYFFERIYSLNLDLRHLGKIQVGAVGKNTASLLLKYGIRANFIPKKYTGINLAQEIPVSLIRNKKIIFPCGDKTGSEALSILQKKSAYVEPVIVYRNLIPKINRKEINLTFKNNFPDVILFSSSSQIDHLVKLLKETSFLNHFRRIPCIVQGPNTFKTAKKNGFKRIILPDQYTSEGMLEALKKLFGR